VISELAALRQLIVPGILFVDGRDKPGDDERESWIAAKRETL
jgi:hypothetical protein